MPSQEESIQNGRRTLRARMAALFSPGKLDLLSCYSDCWWYLVSSAVPPQITRLQADDGTRNQITDGAYTLGLLYAGTLLITPTHCTLVRRWWEHIVCRCWWVEEELLPLRLIISVGLELEWSRNSVLEMSRNTNLTKLLLYFATFREGLMQEFHDISPRK